MAIRNNKSSKSVSKKNVRKNSRIEVAPVRKARKAKRAPGAGRPAGVTAEQSAVVQERVERLYNKYESYGKVAEKMGLSYMAVYLRINRAA